METLTFYALLAVLAVPVAVLGVYRLARVIIYDSFPPSVWLRIQWDNATHKSSWNTLLHCPWCLTPWLMLGAIGWFFAGFFWAAWLLWAWWIFWGWLAMAGLSSMVYVRDERAEH